MIEAIMQISIYLMAVLAPVLLPGIIHVFHVVRDRQETYRQARAVRQPRAAASRTTAIPGFAVPAAA
jgi:hypothetical protein